MTRRLLLRAEARPTERRTPLVPADAARLVAAGVEVSVEASAQRTFDDEAYAAVGCRIVSAGSWVSADPDVVVLGIKELPDQPAAITQRHVTFGHAFKGQPGATDLLARFARGGGTLLDLEYLTDENGRRLVAFGYWAGYVGGALAALAAAEALRAPLVPTGLAELDARLDGLAPALAGRTALVIGALGRVGSGAVAALSRAGLSVTSWDVAETADPDRRALLDHDVLVNALLATSPMAPFVVPSDAAETGRRLRIISDVTCDIGSPLNVLPINDELTTWDVPVRRLADVPPLDVIAIDNLPSLLPREASESFSADLVGLLAGLWSGSAPWVRAAAVFEAVSRGAGTTSG